MHLTSLSIRYCVTLLGCTADTAFAAGPALNVSVVQPSSVDVNNNWGEHERARHRRAKHEKICMYVCMYVCILYLCMFVSLTQISLTPIATLYDNGFSGRV